MKAFFFVFAGFFFFIATAVGQVSASLHYGSGTNMLLTDQVSANLLIPEKPHGLRMRNTGRTLIVCGGVLALGGIIMMNNADALYYSANSSSQGTVEEGDPKGALGVLMTVSGVGMIVPGVILWSKGQKKYNRYREQQSVSFRTMGTTVSFRYSF